MDFEANDTREVKICICNAFIKIRRKKSINLNQSARLHNIIRPAEFTDSIMLILYREIFAFLSTYVYGKGAIIIAYLMSRKKKLLIETCNYQKEKINKVGYSLIIFLNKRRRTTPRIPYRSYPQS